MLVKLAIPRVIVSACVTYVSGVEGVEDLKSEETRTAMRRCAESKAKWRRRRKEKVVAGWKRGKLGALSNRPKQPTLLPDQEANL